MFQDKKIIGYHAGTGFVHSLSGASKLLFFILVSVAAMISYDTRLLLVIAILSLSLFRLSGIRLRDVSFVLVFAGVFAILNILMVYLFAPQYGQDIYGSSTVLLNGFGIYNVSLQELSLQSMFEVPLYHSFGSYFSNDNTSKSICFQSQSDWYSL